RGGAGTVYTAKTPQRTRGWPVVNHRFGLILRSEWENLLRPLVEDVLLGLLQDVVHQVQLGAAEERGVAVGPVVILVRLADGDGVDRHLPAVDLDDPRPDARLD